MKDTLYIIVPAYNEQANILNVINQWYPVISAHSANGTSRLVIIDDGSKDSTYSIALKAAKTRPLLLPITKENSGHGGTVLYGYKFALEHGADFVFQTDSDGQTLPSDFEKFWWKRNDYDIVTKTLKLVIKLCFGVTLTDANTPFRIMKSETLSKYIGLIPDGFNLSNILLSVIYAKKGYSIKYLPITFRPRQGGVNSINLPKIFKIGKQAVKDFKRINKALNEEDNKK